MKKRPSKQDEQLRALAREVFTLRMKLARLQAAQVVNLLQLDEQVVLIKFWREQAQNALVPKPKINADTLPGGLTIFDAAQLADELGMRADVQVVERTPCPDCKLRHRAGIPCPPTTEVT